MYEHISFNEVYDYNNISISISIAILGTDQFPYREHLTAIILNYSKKKSWIENYLLFTPDPCLSRATN